MIGITVDRAGARGRGAGDFFQKRNHQMAYTFHVVSLPHTNTTKAFSSCAYTEKVRKFCRMMYERGHTVHLYAGEKNEAPCTEHIVCIDELGRRRAVGPRHYTDADWNSPQWTIFNANVIKKLSARLFPKDFICLIAGESQKMIYNQFAPSHMVVEFGVGYAGTVAKYRVFESYAWMHACYGHWFKPHSINGLWFDRVIPGYLEPELFPQGHVSKEPYLLYMGRMIDRKGIHIAADISKRTGIKLATAGPGTPPLGADHHFEVGPDERAKLMGGALALLAPTIYCEPFGNVVVEAHACGTPTITTDWGAFTETVQNGVNGFRCRMLRDFIKATSLVKTLNRKKIRTQAIATYGLDAIGLRYERYFDDLYALWGAGNGWYAGAKEETVA